ncbi:MAG: dUTP diphosphatase [Pseudomonadota bacterium]
MPPAGIFEEKKKQGPCVRVLREDWADPTIPLPSYETDGAAGADVRANLPKRCSLTLAPMGRELVPTGLRLEIPEGFEVQVRARSGLALRNGIGLPHGIGTIDADYRGPLGVLLINQGTEPFRINHGDRIAQLVVAPVVQAEFAMTDSLGETKRGSGGFGSTGRD